METSYISLIVKGDRFVAAREAALRGIPFAHVRDTRHGETVGSAPLTAMSRVIAWYHETTGREFPLGRPIGDLLLYSER